MPKTTRDEDLLFHYTSPAGLHGILSTHTFWATDARFMNDSVELIHGASLMRKALDERAAAIEDGSYPLSSATSTTSSITMAIREVGQYLESTATKYPPFLTCFCESGDLLSQWRGYASGGFAIGFHRETLRECSIEESDGQYGSNPELVYAVYKGPYKSQLVDSLTTRITDVVSDRGPFPSGVHESLFVDEEVRPFLSHLKDPAFEEEKEWRIIARTGYMRHRASSLGPLPYISIRFPNHAVRKIIVGPGPNQHLRKLAAESVAYEGPTEHWVVVEPSLAPYRG